VRTTLRGYRRVEVDAFLDRCAAALGLAAAELPELAARGGLVSGPPVTADEVAQVQFRIELRGYGLDDVDELLDRVEAALRRREQPPA
jgi:DivIVA domain-containing protein